MLQSSVALLYPESDRQVAVANPIAADVIERIYAELTRNPRYDANGNLIMSLQGIGLDKDVRYVILECIPRFSEVDVVMAGTGKNSNDAAQWIRNNEKEVLAMLSNGFLNIKFKGRGQKEAPVVTYEQAIHILSMLPSEFGKSLKQQLVSTGVRVEAGDQRMHAVINANANNTSDVHVMACVSAQDKDKYGNLVMRLDEVGLTTPMRFVRTEKGPVFAEIDVVKAVTRKNADYSGYIIRNLSPEVLEEVRENSTNLKFQGPGQKESTVITYQGVLKLIMALPGINAREMRTKFADVLQKYFAGDPALVMEIINNNESTAPINQLAREAQTASVVPIEAPAPQAQLDIACFEQRILSLVRKTDASERRKQLYDGTQAHKRKLIEIEYASQMAVKERKDISELVVSEKEAVIGLEIKKEQEERLSMQAKAELEIKKEQEERLSMQAKAELEIKKEQEGRLSMQAKAELGFKKEQEEQKTIEKRVQQEIEERRKIEAQIELAKLTQAGVAKEGTKPVTTGEPKQPTYYNIAEYTKIFKDLTTQQIEQVLHVAPQKVSDYGRIKAIGTIEEKPGGKMVNYYRKTDSAILRLALEAARSAVLFREQVRAQTQKQNELDRNKQLIACQGWCVGYVDEDQ